MKYIVVVCIIAFLVLGIVICVLLNQGQSLAQEHYNRGFEAGEREGFDKGYLTCWNGLGMNWFGHYKRFMQFQQEYGSIHNTPWDEFLIEEKFTIAMYGGSGSKLEPKEVEEWVVKYGVVR